MQIDQKPGEYRVKASDGSWQTRLNRPLCRWLGIAGLAFVGFQAWRFGLEGGEPIIVIGSALCGVLSGFLLALSLRSID